MVQLPKDFFLLASFTYLMVNTYDAWVFMVELRGALSLPSNDLFVKYLLVSLLIHFNGNLQNDFVG